MEFRIADSFTSALAELTRDEQKAVKTSAFDMQIDPSSPGLQLHRIEVSKDPNFWSVRVNRDIRIIIHKTQASFLLAYVGHHDDAYKWAERRRIEAHPKTGAIQIVEVRELVEELAPKRPQRQPLGAGDADTVPAVLPTKGKSSAPPATPFTSLNRDDLLSIGVPEDWIADINGATEDRFLDLASHLPGEASEALLEFVSTGILKRPAPVVVADPFAHPDALRRFRVVENVEELEQALSYPWDRWIVFLHPSQRALVEKSFTGPARVAGSAGTGKTVVALHRARLLAQAPAARILLTTFSEPLAFALERKLQILAGEKSDVVPRITVASFEGIARELFQLVRGHQPPLASKDIIRSILLKAEGSHGFTERFLISEWTHVVDAWQIKSAAAYANVPRLGRKNRMGSKQRDRLWPIFDRVLKELAARGFETNAGVFQTLTAHYSDKQTKPFTHVVVDEAQDLGVPELRFLRAIAPAEPDALFFAGDLGQRIFQQPFSWKALGVDVQGRSMTLKVNYRTSHQIRQAADRLLSRAISDVDGREEERRGTVSVFNGPTPVISLHDTPEQEGAAVAAFIQSALTDGTQPEEIGLFVRNRDALPRARAAIEKLGLTAAEITPRKEGPVSAVRIGIMHLAKGLEFKAVAVMACDENLLPLQERIEAVADEVELDDVYATERQLFYVACTRARDRLIVTAVRPGSEFIDDLVHD
ncbi:DEAD/DEAH box helicase [Rhodomicrobium vannielii ATCC 17100]|uniref:3'-5' exonuclease n=1 Tax=Rhodomicrobium vannielii TaxID=1069 RepID=UPI0019196E15|nr:3'-5' exonuclease [Rhodomicrobium vannielii]MBJ7533252.1 DEAD/DEAH box helicase [Rhodomicrobium vannielii ATCC 17100]